jgi:hypothetical protein
MPARKGRMNNPRINLAGFSLPEMLAAVDAFITEHADDGGNPAMRAEIEATRVRAQAIIRASFTSGDGENRH